MTQYPEIPDSDVLCRVRRVVFPDGSVEVLGRFVVLRVVGAGPEFVRLETAEERAVLHRDRAERRARRELRWALMCVRADRILTLTYRENVQDLKRARLDWRYFCQLVRGRFPKWQYAVVLELQARGAIHFHAGVAGWQDVKFLRACWLRVVGSDGGNIDVAVGKARWGSESEVRPVRKIAAYLAKYLGKAFDWMPKGSRRFVASEDRGKPVIDRWWMECGDDKGRVIEVLYRAACGLSAVGVGQWLSSCGEWFSAWSSGPPLRSECPF